MTPLRWQHKERSRLTIEVGRYSTLMVARLLGVPDTRIRYWIKHRWLKARKRTSGGINYWVISEDDILLFLRTYGAAQWIINPPSEEWQCVVERERAVFFKHHISTRDIAALLGVVPDHISNGLKKYFAFPAAVYRFHTQEGGDYFEKHAIITWLRAHPMYDPKGRIRRYLAGISNEER